MLGSNLKAIFRVYLAKFMRHPSSKSLLIAYRTEVTEMYQMSSTYLYDQFPKCLTVFFFYTI